MRERKIGAETLEKIYYYFINNKTNNTVLIFTLKILRLLSVTKSMMMIGLVYIVNSISINIIVFHNSVEFSYIAQGTIYIYI